MRKLISVLALLAGMAMPAHARSQKPQVDTSDFAIEICTSTTINISRTVATEVIGASVFLGSATFIDVYNVESSTGIACGWDNQVSVSSGSITFGREVPARASLSWSINLDKIPGYWCQSEHATNNTRAVITKCR